ncbi:hypothetical protein [Erwinia piriflorinigrans]|uniref:Uncharacterized protein n=1 Tax=Erwinia piriflorinigrans CFBP 5888 TaxID=1161919 RepID=V5Z523_9GAMM|nr:hypothetical protein [Erwinia piriflorinigrans]CCG86006.1 hypothetical protein EPIR_0641 [Erwinia piriflorinigrans CFBP 5888]
MSVSTSSASACMSIYDITVARLGESTRSCVDFIMMISVMESALLTIRALNNCGIPDHIDQDGCPDRVWEVIHIAELLGEACELKLIPEYLFQRYVAEVILIGLSLDECVWNYGFRDGISNAHFAQMVD